MKKDDIIVYNRVGTRKQLNKQYDRETLLHVLYSYKILIERNKDYPTVLIDDIEKSINHVLNVNNYGARDYSEHGRRKQC